MVRSHSGHWLCSRIGYEQLLGSALPGVEGCQPARALCAGPVSGADRVLVGGAAQGKGETRSALPWGAGSGLPFLSSMSRAGQGNAVQFPGE